MLFFTYADAVDLTQRYLGAGGASTVLVDVLQAIDEAYRDVVNAHTWSYYYATGRLIMNAPYATGVIGYQATGGAYPYQVTLAGGTWPSWAADGYIYANATACRVDQLISPTVLTFLPPQVPAADFAGVGYQLYQDSYVLPEDFTAGDQFLYQLVFGELTYVHPRDWQFSHRYYYFAGVPQWYTVDSDIKYPGRMVVRISPLPSQPYTLDFLYKRRPRPLRVFNSSSGTIQVAATQAAVVGTNTQFSPMMAPWQPGQGGSVLRISGNSQPPTWTPQGNVPAFEGQVYTVADPTHLALMPLTPSTVTYAAAPYTLSDPVDIERGSMLNAFIWACRSKIAGGRIMKDKMEARAEYLDQLVRAREADSRSFAGRVEGGQGIHRQMMKDMPRGPDMGS